MNFDFLCADVFEGVDSEIQTQEGKSFGELFGLDIACQNNK